MCKDFGLKPVRLAQIKFQSLYENLMQIMVGKCEIVCNDKMFF